jgi:hypothetical protein
MAAGLMLGLLAQMSQAFRSGGEREGSSAEGGIRSAEPGQVTGHQSSVISDQSSVISDQCRSASGGEVATDDRSLVTDNIPASSTSGGVGAGTAAKTVEEAETEHHTLEQRLGLMSRAVTGITQLRKREQADMAMELKRERLKQTQEMVNLHGERLKFQARVHEDKLALQKASAGFDDEGEQGRGGVPPKEMDQLVEDIQLW